MAVAIAHLLERFGAKVGAADALREGRVLSLDWPELDDALPDHGLPRGVVELAAPGALGGGASIACAAMRAAHAKDRRAWCAWIDPEATLHAPGLASAGVDLSRLLVVRPPRAELARVAVKVAASRAFDVIAIDVDVVPGAIAPDEDDARARPPTRRKGMAPDGASARNARCGPHETTLVRKLALLAEEGGASVLLLTDSTRPRAQPWPVALRLELSRAPSAIALRVAKDKQGRVGLAKTVPFVRGRARRRGEPCESPRCICRRSASSSRARSSAMKRSARRSRWSSRGRAAR